MQIPVTVSFSPALRPFGLSVSQRGTVTVRVFPGWVFQVRSPWR